MSGVEVELYYREEATYDDADEVETRRKRRRRIAERLETLQNGGHVAEYETRTCRGGTPVQRDPTRGGTMKSDTDRYDAYTCWAAQRGLTLEPNFEESGGHISFPPLYLVVKRRDGSDVKAVFPCSDGDREYTIEDYLDATENGGDWRKDGRGSSPPDYGVHGAIKAHLRNHSEEHFNEDWNWESDEYPVHRGSGPLEAEGRIDLVFRHEAETRFLLVEVKPAEDEVDKAFGQILRYKHQFLDHREIPGLTPEDVELAIASTEFYESHRRAAEEVGVRLVEVRGK